ncbi:Uncharacterised protein [Starkeya nomas]|uniref:Probable branched-chain-amino-acid aminotransferase n=1 Tax=Starkeya nomas TaxID=2666134 RepID=A0A5S9PB96_9HYPH|nr:aminotransferase class IV [Starkeya nomas]CAA0100933.1 Uncharacterised protein [Starkeya nomas]
MDAMTDEIATLRGRYAGGAAYLDGEFMPLAEAKIPVTHWGYRRSDVTYDVVGVRDGRFFRLDDHIRRFRNSMTALHMEPPEGDAEIRDILMKLVLMADVRDAYVSMECLRASPAPGALRHPASCRSYLSCSAVPWISVVSPEMEVRGMHLMIPKVKRIPPSSFDPRVKNFHWGDLTEGMFEAKEAGADFAVLTDETGNVTEGPGFNVFCIVNGRVITPARGGLDGITRLSVFELCEELGLPLEIRDVTVEEFVNADEIFACTTAGGIMPATRIDGRILGNDVPGPISMQLKETFWQKRAEGWHGTEVL